LPIDRKFIGMAECIYFAGQNVSQSINEKLGAMEND
jgi:hypothetical protein